MPAPPRSIPVLIVRMGARFYARPFAVCFGGDILGEGATVAAAKDDLKAKLDARFPDGYDASIDLLMLG